MSSNQGVRRPTLPEVPPRYDARSFQRAFRLIEQFMLEVHGRFLNDQTVTVESWEGAAVAVIGDTVTPTSDSTVLTKAKNGIYFIDATLVVSAGASQETATFAVQVDPDGSSGFSTVATYTFPVSAATEGTSFVQLAFASATLQAGGEVRIAGSGTDVSTADDYTATLTPLRVRGQ